MAQKVRRGDLVSIRTGRDKGCQGRVQLVLTEKGRVIVENIAMVTRHTKPSPSEPEGGRVRKPMSIHISNVALVDPESGEATRVGFRFNAEGQKERFAKKSGATIARPAH